MTHEQDEVMKALEFLDNFSDDFNYKQNLTIIYDYIGDIVEMMGNYKQTAEKTTKLLLNGLTQSKSRQSFQKIAKKR